MIVNRMLRYNPVDRLILWIAGFFGDKAKEVERFLKFALVGTLGAVVDFTVLNILQRTLLVPEGTAEEAQLKVAVATAIAFTTAVINNYILNRYWTYPDSRSTSVRRQLFQFFIVSTVGLAFRFVFVGATFRFFGETGASILTPGGMEDTAINQLGSNIAQGISIIIVLFWNFFANRLWTFNDVE